MGLQIFFLLKLLKIHFLVGSIAQYFIADMIKCFGALPLSITMTIRKFTTVFLSCLIYGNVLLARQWLAASVIFLALLADAIFQTESKKEEKNKNGDAGDQEVAEKSVSKNEALKSEEEQDKMIEKPS